MLTTAPPSPVIGLPATDGPVLLLRLEQAIRLVDCSAQRRRGFVAYTANEALRIPCGTSRPTVRRVLRWFVSGLQPISKRRCYGHGLMTDRDTVVLDDPPWPVVVESLERLSQSGNTPASIDFRTRRMSFATDAVGRLTPIQRSKAASIRVDRSSRVHIITVEYASPHLGFVSREDQAAGVSDTRAIAERKATVEAIERLASGNLCARDLLISPARDLPLPHLDPRSIFAFARRQLRSSPDLRPFRNDEVRLWIRGELASGQPMFVLADIVYYPFSSEGKTHARANSSGVAADVSRDIAKKRAYLELVERDAFMCLWLQRASREKVILSTLPNRAQSIASAVRSAGWRVSIVNMTRRGHMTAILTVAERDRQIVVGAAAGHPIDACVHALEELLASTAAAISPLRPLRPSEVRSPTDHRTLYLQQDYYHHASFLTRSQSWIPFNTLPSVEISFPEDCVFVQLHPPISSRIEVWRCLSPRLVPITFGFDAEPVGLRRVKRMLQRRRVVRQGTLFPHPFG